MSIDRILFWVLVVMSIASFGMAARMPMPLDFMLIAGGIIGLAFARVMWTRG